MSKQNKHLLTLNNGNIHVLRYTTVRWRNDCENRHNINLNEMSL